MRIFLFSCPNKKFQNQSSFFLHLKDEILWFLQKRSKTPADHTMIFDCGRMIFQAFDCEENLIIEQFLKNLTKFVIIRVKSHPYLPVRVQNAWTLDSCNTDTLFCRILNMSCARQFCGLFREKKPSDLSSFRHCEIFVSFETFSSTHFPINVLQF